jgi:hypothetical protein
MLILKRPLEIINTAFDPSRVFSVSIPIKRVVHDVHANALESSIVANDVLKVIALPREGFQTATTDTFRDDGFELTHDRTKRTRFETARFVGIGARAGDPAGRPYHVQDAVDVVRHDHKGVQLNVVADSSCVRPFLENDFAKCVQSHLSISDLAERVRPFLDNYRKKIRSSAPVIVRSQPYRLPLLHTPIVGATRWVARAPRTRTTIPNTNTVQYAYLRVRTGRSYRQSGTTD